MMRALVDAACRSPLAHPDGDEAEELRLRVQAVPVAVNDNMLGDAFQLLAGLLLDLHATPRLTPPCGDQPPPMGAQEWPDRVHAKGRALRRVQGVAG